MAKSARDKSAWCLRRHRSLLHHGQEQEKHARKDGNEKYDPVVRKHVMYKEAKIK